MPARSGNGLAMRQGMFLEALSRVFDTHLVVVPVAGGFQNPQTLPDELGAHTTLIPVAGRQDSHFSLLARLADPVARVAAFRSYGRSSLAAHLSVPVLTELGAAAGQGTYDLVHVGRSYLADALSVASGTRATMDLDEDEWTSYREVGVTLRNGDPAGAAWAEAEATAMSSLIERSASGVARHFISSELDAEWIGRRHPGLPLEVVENAVVVPGQHDRRDDGGTLLFLGAFGYTPNVDAARWLVQDIWPIVRRRAERPARLVLIGRDPDRVDDLGTHPGVELRGAVPDVADAYAAATLFVAPLRAGAGTRMKLLEAAAHRVPIVTTSLGARGLPLVAGHDVLIADDVDGFAAAILDALQNREASGARAGAAHAIVWGRYDRAQAVERLACRLHDIVAR
jgi:glycosyltransferase involved in cell wall biosynthesis